MDTRYHMLYFPLLVVTLVQRNFRQASKASITTKSMNPVHKQVSCGDLLRPRHKRIPPWRCDAIEPLSDWGRGYDDRRFGVE